MDRRDVWFFTGLILIGAGGWIIYPPMAFLVPGFILVGVAIFGVKA